MRLRIFILVLAIERSTQSTHCPRTELDKVTPSATCMMQVEVPALGRISFHSRGYASRFKRDNHTLADGHGTKSKLETSHAQTKTSNRMGKVAPIGLVRHTVLSSTNCIAGLHSVLLSLWSRCHVAVKGAEGPMLGGLVLLSSITFFIFAALTLHFTRGGLIRNAKKESQLQNGAAQRRRKGPTNASPAPDATSPVHPAYRQQESFDMKSSQHPGVQDFDARVHKTLERQKTLLPGSFMASPLPERSFVVEDDKRLPETVLPEQFPQAPSYHVKDDRASQDNLFAEQVDLDYRSLGYNFDSLRRNPFAMGGEVNPTINIGGIVPQEQIAAPPVTPVSGRSSPQSTKPGGSVAHNSGSATPSFSGVATVLPPLEMPQFTSPGSGSLNPSAPRNIQYHSIATARGQTEDQPVVYEQALWAPVDQHPGYEHAFQAPVLPSMFPSPQNRASVQAILHSSSSVFSAGHPSNGASPLTSNYQSRSLPQQGFQRSRSLSPVICQSSSAPAQVTTIYQSHSVPPSSQSLSLPSQGYLHSRSLSPANYRYLHQPP